MTEIGNGDDIDRQSNAENGLSVNRRRLLKAGLATTVVAGGGLAGVATARTDEEWEDLALREQLNVIRKATQPYKKLERMAEAGYVSAPIPLVCREGLHFDNLAFWDGEFDPERPESLFYMISDGGKLKLGGAEFILITELDENGEPVDSKPDLFNDESEPLGGSPLRGTSEAEGWHLFTEFGPPFWDLHVWVHERNPDGVFSLPNHRFADMPGCVPLADL